MARALWKGAISFGLVHIPVELISASLDHELELSMLDRRDFAPVGYQRYNKQTGKEVAWDDIVKGYEYKTDEYVVLSDADLKQANVKATQTIDILTFVDASEVPLTFYEHPYYLLPAKGGEKVYALLRETLRKAGKVGVATMVMRTKQHLCALVCIGDAIVLNTLRYADEIRATDDLDLPGSTLKAAGISDKELKMALSLVEGMSEAWQPQQYHDSYREDVLALVKKKIKTKQTRTITAPEADSEEQAPASNVVDLVALLQQSLGKKGQGCAQTCRAQDSNTPAQGRLINQPAVSSAIKAWWTPTAAITPSPMANVILAMARAASPAAYTPGTDVIFIVSVCNTGPIIPSSTTQPSRAASGLACSIGAARNSARRGSKRPSCRRTPSMAGAAPSMAVTATGSMETLRRASNCRASSSSDGMPAVNRVTSPQSAIRLAWCTEAGKRPSTPMAWPPAPPPIS